MNNHQTCPLCGQLCLLNDYLDHLTTNHLDTMLTLFSFQLGQLNAQDYLNYLHQQIDSYIDTMEYEDMLELCDAIGYHTVGISDIHTIASKIDPIEDTCPICLESYTEKEIYQTHKCKHIFCKECLSTWINKHKTCPMCQQELQ
jgi:hypothetical protein